MLIGILRMPSATFNRPSVSHQSRFRLIVAVTGCHVPAVFSHISSSPIFCKGGQSKKACSRWLKHHSRTTQSASFESSEQRTAPLLLLLLLAEFSTKDSTMTSPSSPSADIKLYKNELPHAAESLATFNVPFERKNNSSPLRIMTVSSGTAGLFWGAVWVCYALLLCQFFVHLCQLLFSLYTSGIWADNCCIRGETDRLIEIKWR